MLDRISLTALIHKDANCDPTAMSAVNVMRMATVGGTKALGMEEAQFAVQVRNELEGIRFV